MLADDSIVAIASEGANRESLNQTEAIVRAIFPIQYSRSKICKQTFSIPLKYQQSRSY